MSRQEGNHGSASGPSQDSGKSPVGSVDTIFDHTPYIGLSAIILNLAVSVVLTLVSRAASVPADLTSPA